MESNEECLTGWVECLRERVLIVADDRLVDIDGDILSIDSSAREIVLQDRRVLIIRQISPMESGGIETGTVGTADGDNRAMSSRIGRDRKGHDIGWSSETASVRHAESLGPEVVVCRFGWVRRDSAPDTDV